MNCFYVYAGTDDANTRLRIAQGSARDVNGNVIRFARGLDCSVEQQCGLRSAAGSQFNERLRITRRGDDLLGVVAQNRPLSAGEVVLRQFCDAFEEQRTLMIV